ncbi:MAG: hypothetical protein IKO10_16005 [Lachnospiraceae bacterium]|nr:hypothetical protein [Lachnospiraceae bacterium]
MESMKCKVAFTKIVKGKNIGTVVFSEVFDNTMDIFKYLKKSDQQVDIYKETGNMNFIEIRGYRTDKVPTWDDPVANVYRGYRDIEVNLEWAFDKLKEQGSDMTLPEMIDRIRNKSIPELGYLKAGVDLLTDEEINRIMKDYLFENNNNLVGVRKPVPVAFMEVVSVNNKMKDAAKVYQAVWHSRRDGDGSDYPDHWRTFETLEDLSVLLEELKEDELFYFNVTYDNQYYWIRNIEECREKEKARRDKELRYGRPVHVDWNEVPPVIKKERFAAFVENMMKELKNKENEQQEQNEDMGDRDVR